MTNIKEPEARTQNRLVTYVTDTDYEDFMTVLADRDMRATHYLRLLLSAHLQALRDSTGLVAPKEESDADL